MQLFTLYFGDKVKGVGFSISCTNKRVLAEALNELLANKTGISYENLVKLFTREKRNYIEIQGYIIIQSKVLLRGGQRIKVSKSDTTYIRSR